MNKEVVKKWGSVVAGVASANPATRNPLPPVDAATKMKPVIHRGSTDLEVVAALEIKAGTKVCIGKSPTLREVICVTEKGKLRLKGVRHVVDPRKVSVLKT